MYAQDLDFCWRTHREGWKVWFAAEAEFVHVGGASSDRRWAAQERSEQVARAEAATLRSHMSRQRAEAALAFMRRGWRRELPASVWSGGVRRRLPVEVRWRA